MKIADKELNVSIDLKNVTYTSETKVVVVMVSPLITRTVSDGMRVVVVTKLCVVELDVGSGVGSFVVLVGIGLLVVVIVGGISVVVGISVDGSAVAEGEEISDVVVGSTVVVGSCELEGSSVALTVGVGSGEVVSGTEVVIGSGYEVVAGDDDASDAVVDGSG